MKSKLLVAIFLFVSFLNQAQEVFSEAFLGDAPFAIETVNDELYVSIWNDNEDLPYGLYKLTFENPDDPILVADLEDWPGLGAVRLLHHNETNEVYGFLPFNDHFVVDLSGNLPLAPTFFQTIPTLGAQQGVLERDGFLIGTLENPKSIIRMSLSNLNGTPETLYTFDDLSWTPVSGFYNDDLYFFEKNGDTYTLYSLDISTPGQVPNVISILDEISSSGFNRIQDSFIKGDYLYFSLNDSDNRGVYKMDLSQENPEAQLIASVSADIIGLTSHENYIYYVSNQRINRIEEETLSVEDFIETIQFEIYPNPANDLIQVNLEKDEISKISVFNLLGQKVLEGGYKDSGFSVSTLKEGVYLLDITTIDGQVQVKRFIKH